MSAPINAAGLIGTHDVLFVTLDTALRCRGNRIGRRKNTQSGESIAGRRMGTATFAGDIYLCRPPGLLRWILSHSNGAETHHRLFAARFARSETTGPHTALFDAPDIVSGLFHRGYHTICIGGVGFFNKLTPLGNVLPSLFAESHWSPEMGVTDPASTERQVCLAKRLLIQRPRDSRVFLFVNISALHQPNCIFMPSAIQDNKETQTAALAYVDAWLPMLFDAMRRRGPSLVILCSDHGTAYGEAGYTGHRMAHPVVWNVPYAEFVLEDGA